MANKLFGVPISDDVVKQLKIREKNSGNNEKSISDILLDNNRGAWIQLCSGVQMLNDDVIKQKNYLKKYLSSNLKSTQDKAKIHLNQLEREKGDYSNALASANVLVGGTAYNTSIDPNAQGEDRVKLARREGINFQDIYSPLGSEGSYEPSEIYGFRPMAGITSMKVQSMGANGTIRKATVGMTAHSPEQLTILEKLYFRPGFTMLLEWGNSVYRDNEGEDNSQNLTLASKFLTADSGSLKELKQTIITYKKNSSYNYDAMVGKVVNFNYTIAENNAFDCEIEMLAEGDILDSLKATFNTPEDDPVTKFKDSGQAESSGGGGDILIDTYEALKNTKETENIKNELFGTSAPDLYVYRSLPLKRTYKKVVDTEQDPEGQEETEETYFMYYISLYDVFRILNKRILEKQDTGSSQIRISTAFDDSRFTTFPGHISNDPGICTMPYRSGKAYSEAADRIKEVNLYGGIQKDGKGVYEPEPVTISSGLYHNEGKNKAVPRESGAASKFLPEFEGYNEESPLKILFNIDYLIAKQQAFLDDNKNLSKNAISQYMNGILADASYCLGSINNLKLILKENSDEFVVIDERIDVESSPTGLPLINVVGLKTSTENIELSSKIGKDIINALSIGAAQGGYGSEGALQGILKYNEDVKDRFAPEYKEQKSDSDPAGGGDTPITANWKRVRITGAETIAKPWHSYVTKQIYSQDLYNSAKDVHAEFMKALFEYKEQIQRYKGIPRPYPVGIPVELGMTIRGISGLKIGEAFAINRELIPGRLRDSVGFIITGLDQEIGDDNYWRTVITTTMYPLGDVAVGPLPKNEDDYFEIVEEVAEGDPSTPNANRLRAAIAAAGYREKGEELSNGGDITADMYKVGKRLIELVKSQVPAVKLKFTGGNDKYHQKLSYNSRHKSGRALDFVISPFSTSNYNKVKDILYGLAAGNDDVVRFLDEYKKMTAAATGQHFHLSFGKGSEGKATLKEAKAKANAGQITKYPV